MKRHSHAAHLGGLDDDGTDCMGFWEWARWLRVNYPATFESAWEWQWGPR